MTIQELFEKMLKKVGLVSDGASNYTTKYHIPESKRIVKRKMTNESRKRNRR